MPSPPESGMHRSIEALSDMGRLARLYQLQLLSREKEPAFDHTTSLVRSVLTSATAVFAVLDEKEIYFKSTAGEMPLIEYLGSPAGLVFAQTIVVENRCLQSVATSHSFDGLGPCSSAPENEISMLGVPVRDEQGQILGILCVLDFGTRRWDTDSEKMLCEFSQIIESQLACRRCVNEAEEKVKQTEERMKNVLGRAECLIWEADVRFENEELRWKIFTQPSGIFRRLFGERHAVVTTSMWDRFEVPEIERMDQRCRAALTSGAPNYSQEFPLVRDGETMWMSETVNVTKTGPNRFWLTGLTIDVTKSKQLELKLAEARDSALESSRLKSEFLANMSHEIRTPMNGVVGMANMLLDTKMSAEQRQMGEVIQQSSDALLTVINDILDFSKIEAGKLSIINGPFNLRSLIAETVALFWPRARAKGVTLRSTISPKLPPVVIGDAGRIRQIILNLTGNAVKFTERGSVELVVNCTRADSGNCAVSVSVHDTGKGIAPDVQRQLFHPFVQADGSHTRRHGGSGLGLAICRQLTELMGGSIGLRSEMGRGAEFWFSLELEPGEASTLDAVSSSPSTVSSPRAESSGGIELSPPASENEAARILLVEDNPNNQLVARLTLEKMGYLVGIAANGVEALRQLEHGKFDAVLMDCQMPEMDGFEAARRVRSGSIPGVDADIPIIAVTAYAMVGDEMNCRSAGMDDFVSKPIHRPKLRAALERCGVPPPAGLIDDAPGAPQAKSEIAPTLETDFHPDTLMTCGLIDEEHVRECRAEEGLDGASLWDGMVDIYLQDDESRFDSLGTLITNEAYEDAAQLTHTMAGSCAYLGATSLRESLISLERALRSDDLEQIGGEFKKSAELLRRLRRLLVQYVETRESDTSPGACELLLAQAE